MPSKLVGVLKMECPARGRAQNVDRTHAKSITGDVGLCVDAETSPSILVRTLAFLQSTLSINMGGPVTPGSWLHANAACPGRPTPCVHHTQNEFGHSNTGTSAAMLTEKPSPLPPARAARVGV